jgi:hypothetical protein
MQGHPMSLPEVLTLEYASPQIKSRRWFYFVDLSLASILIGGWSFLLLWPLPYFRNIFSDFKTSLPLPTEYLLAFYDLYFDDFLWVGAVALAFIAPLPIGALRQRCRCDTTGPATAVFIIAEIVALMLLLIVALIVSWACLLLPLVKLIQSVSGGS